MKICHIVNTLSGGGAENHLLDLCKLQTADDINVSIIVLGPDLKNFKSLENEFKKLGINIYRLQLPRLFNPVSIYNFFRILNQTNFKTVHSHQPRSDVMVYVYRLFRRHKFRWIVSIHGKYDTYLEKNIFLDYLKKTSMPLLRFVWSKCDYIICISEEVKSWLVQPKSFKNVKVINYWLNDVNLNQINSYDGVLKVGFLGRINQNKGIEDLLKVLTTTKNLEFELFIGGVGDENYISQLKKKFNTEQKQNIKFLGYIDNKISFFKELNLFVFPSYSEGLGLVLLESMGSSTITLARNEPPMNSIINTNVGYLFDDSDGLKKEILNISYAYQNDLNIINQKLKKQYELLKTNYNSGVLYKEILKVYEH